MDLEIKKSNKGLIALIIVLILIILGLGGYIVYDKFLAKEEKTEAKTEEKEEVVEQEPITSEVLYSDGEEKILVNEFTVNDEKYTFAVEGVRLEQVVKVNGNVVFTNRHMTGSIHNVYRIGDLILVHEISGDVRGSVLIFVDLDGNIVKELDSWPQGNVVMGFASSYENSLVLDGATLSIKATALYHSLLVVYGYETANTELPLSDADKATYGITDETIVEGVYKITYLGNEEFSELELTESETYNELLEKYRFGSY